MNKFLNIVARVILTAVVLSIAGLFGVAFYQHPEVILPLFGGIAGVVLVVWAINRVFPAI